jgi:hypothetical protein
VLRHLPACSQGLAPGGEGTGEGLFQDPQPLDHPGHPGLPYQTAGPLGQVTPPIQQAGLSPALHTTTSAPTQCALIHILAAGWPRVSRGAGADGLAIDRVGVTVGALIAGVTDASVIKVAQQTWAGQQQSVGIALPWPGNRGLPAVGVHPHPTP